MAARVEVAVELRQHDRVQDVVGRVDERLRVRVVAIEAQPRQQHVLHQERHVVRVAVAQPAVVALRVAQRLPIGRGLLDLRAPRVAHAGRQVRVEPVVAEAEVAAGPLVGQPAAVGVVPRGVVLVVLRLRVREVLRVAGHPERERIRGEPAVGRVGPGALVRVQLGEELLPAQVVGGQLRRHVGEAVGRQQQPGPAARGRVRDRGRRGKRHASEDREKDSRQCPTSGKPAVHRPLPPVCSTFRAVRRGIARRARGVTRGGRRGSAGCRTAEAQRTQRGGN